MVLHPDDSVTLQDMRIMYSSQVKLPLIETSDNCASFTRLNEYKIVKNQYTIK